MRGKQFPQMQFGHGLVLIVVLGLVRVILLFVKIPITLIFVVLLGLVVVIVVLVVMINGGNLVLILRTVVLCAVVLVMNFGLTMR